MLLREIKSIFHKELVELYPKDEIDSFFYTLIWYFYGLERFVLAIDPNLVISKEQETLIFAALADLRLGRPVQYVIGKAHFMELDFIAGPDVLIPRPETEELVRWILKDIMVVASTPLSHQDPKQTPNPVAERSRSDGDPGSIDNRASASLSRLHEPFKILDIGTGSGCIAISLAKNLDGSEVHAMDISAKALEVAKANSALHGAKVEFIEMDIMNPECLPLKFDLIVSNPPYVRQSEKMEMHRNVKDHEPDMALFVPDNDSLVFYKAIARFARAHLKENGTLFLEINQYLGKETVTLLGDHNFTEIELRKDMFGNDRMIRACW